MTSATPPAESEKAPPTYKPVVLQAGAFRSASHAETARAELSRRLQGVVIVRLEGSKEPTYTVRILGLRSTRDVLDAEAELHRLGYSPLHIDESATHD